MQSCTQKHKQPCQRQANETSPLVSNSYSDVDVPSFSPPPYSAISPQTALVDESLQQKKSKSGMLVFKLVKYSIWVLIPSIVVFLVVNMAVVIPRLEGYMSESIQASVEDVEFAGVSRGLKAVDFVIALNVDVDYRRLNNSYLYNLFNLNGKVFKSVQITLDDVSIRLLDEIDENKSDVDNAVIKLGLMAVKPFKVYIQQEASTPLKLFITLKPDPKELYKFLQKLLNKMQKGDSPIIFRAFLDTQIKLVLGVVPVWHKFAIHYNEKIDLLQHSALLKKWVTNTMLLPSDTASDSPNRFTELKLPELASQSIKYIGTSLDIIGKLLLL